MQSTLEDYFEDVDLDTNTDADADTDVESNHEFETLQAEIEHLSATANLLSHRVDTMQTLLDQETFQLDSYPIRVAPIAKAENVRKLLVAIDVTEEGLTIGKFLRALNLYFIRNDLVDLNDLQINLSPLVAAAFQKAKGLKKVPYSLLLATLPRMFA